MKRHRYRGIGILRNIFPTLWAWIHAIEIGIRQELIPVPLKKNVKFN